MSEPSRSRLALDSAALVVRAGVKGDLDAKQHTGLVMVFAARPMLGERRVNPAARGRDGSRQGYQTAIRCRPGRRADELADSKRMFGLVTGRPAVEGDRPAAAQPFQKAGEPPHELCSERLTHRRTSNA